MAKKMKKEMHDLSPPDKPTAKLAALTRSMQQIANLDPADFNSANKAVSMAKAALLINREK